MTKYPKIFDFFWRCQFWEFVWELFGFSLLVAWHGQHFMEMLTAFSSHVKVLVAWHGFSWHYAFMERVFALSGMARVFGFLPVLPFGMARICQKPIWK